MIKRIFTAGVMLASLVANGQDYLQCGLSEAEKTIAHNKSVMQQRQQLEVFTNDFVAKMKLQPQHVNGAVIYTIPVVFHIMHDYGNENVSEAQVRDALRIINEDFQKTNADTVEVASVFIPIVADCQIQFKLAQLDPNGNCTDGITRHATILTYQADDNVKAIVDWDHTKYLNIWVVRNISFGAAGYSYYPGVGPQQDGIVIRHDYFGSIGTSPNSSYNRHSLSHEIGHYINLMHTWGNSNSPGSWSNCADDDQVFDTPNTIGVNNFTCDTNQITCTAGVTDNVQNYMDYSACHNMFTEGQKTRMHAALNNGASGRDNLVSANNLLETGTNAGYAANACAPVADFAYFQKFSCESAAVSFTDRSWNTDGAYSRVWNFPGGVPATSTDSIPVVSYPLFGTYNVSLTVSNAAGSNTVTRNGFVNVIPVAGTVAAPFSESFEALSFPGNFWFLENESGNSWQIVNGISYTGSKCIKLNNYNGNPVGTTDEFYTEGYDLSNLTNTTMNFKYAFATRNNSIDNLRVFYSIDCGKTWIMRFNKSGTNLATVGNLSNNFVPGNPSQWQQGNLIVNALGGKENVRFKFEFHNQGGNNIYIDDINIGGIPVGVNELNPALVNLQVMPNPAQTRMNADFSLENNSLVTMKIFNLLGSCVKIVVDEKLNAGTHHYTIENNFPTGIYMLQLTVDGKTTTQKIIFE